jgi:phosphoesterase family protein/glycosyl hydrolase family 12
MVTAIAIRTALARLVVFLVVFFALYGLAEAQSTYDSALTNGIPITNRYTAGGAEATSVVVDKNNGTNLWWMYPDVWGLSAGTGLITMNYTGAGSVTTTVNMTGLNITAVNAYPFFFLGCAETSCIAPPTQAPSFPAQLNTISSMPVDFAYNLSGSDFHGDITFDEWISNTPNGTSPSEIMVMTDFNFGYGYYGTHIETVNVPASVNGAATTLPFTVYYGGGTVFFILDSTQHPYITSGEVQFDLLYFLKEGARIDGANSAYYVQGIEFGTEFGNSATQNYTFNLTKFKIGAMAASPTPTPDATPTPKDPEHVFLLLEENTGYSSVVGNTAEMPYFNNLISQGALATSYYADFHPSLPNYIELTSGSNNGVTTDECGTNFPSISADNIVRHLIGAGVTWHEYAEDIPGAGYIDCSTGYYDSDHVPFRDYTDVQNSSSQQQNIVPFSQFATDLLAGTFAQVNYIAPNLVDDGHSCPGFAASCSPTPLQNTDAWLLANIQPLLSSPMFQAGGDGLLIIVWDEGDFADSSYGGGQVAWLAIGPRVKAGYQQGSTTVYQHESTLRLIMEKAGLTSFPGSAATAPDMTEFFTAATPTPTPSPSPSPTPTPKPLSVRLRVHPSSVSFGRVPAGSASAPKIITLVNPAKIGGPTITLTSELFAGEFGFLPAGTTCFLSITQLAPKQPCTIAAVFQPKGKGRKTGTLTLGDNARDRRQAVHFVGTGE